MRWRCYSGRKFPNLSSTEPTNWMLQNAPDVYLYGSLLELEPFVQNDARLAVWAKGYENAIENIPVC